MSPKGQSAVELLTTYGWAFLVILGMIAALTYFGFSDVNSKIPSTCNFGQGFSCENFYSVNNGSFAFEIKNLQRTAINISKLRCFFEDNRSYLANLSPEILDVGSKAILFCNSSVLGLTDEFTGKNKFKAKIYYSYDEKESLPRVVTGELIIPSTNDYSVLESYVNNSIPVLAVSELN